MADNQLDIRATADFGQVNESFDATATNTQRNTESMQSAWQRLRQSVSSAMSGVASSVREGATAVSAATTEMKEKLVETAEAANLAKGGFNAFGAATAVLGAGAVVGMLGEMAHKAAESAIQIGNLSDATGIAVKSLSEMQYVAARQDVSWESVEKSIRKMTAAMDAARNGGQQQEEAFKRLGVSMADLKSKSPEEVMLKISDSLNKLESPAQRAHALTTLFGRGWVDAATFLRGGSDEIKKLMENADALGGVLNDEAVASAREFDDAMDDLSQQLKSLSIPLIEGTNYALKGLLTGFGALKVGIVVIGDTVAAFLLTLYDGVVGSAKALERLAHLDWSGAKAAASQAADNIKGSWKAALDDMTDSAVKFDESQQRLWAKPSQRPKDGKLGLADDSGASSAGKDTRLQQWQQELQQKKDDEDTFHELSKEAEAQFWQSKLSKVKEGTELYKQVSHLFREAEKAADKEYLKDVDQDERLKIEATKSGTQQRINAINDAMKKVEAIGGTETEAYKGLQKAKVEAEKALHEQEVKDAQDAAKRLQQIAQTTAEGELAAAKSAADAKRQQSDFELQLGQINSKKHLAMQKQALDEEYQAQLQALEKERDLLNKLSPDYPNEFLKNKNKISALEAQWRQKSQQLDQKFVLDKQKTWNSFFNGISRGFSGTIQGMIQGTQTFAQGMANMFTNILLSFVDMLVQMGVQWVANWLFMHLFKRSLDASSTEAAIAAASAEAGAKGTASFAGAPWPIDMGAPAFGMSMAAAAAGYSSYGFAEKGALVQDDQLFQLHKNETVLPAEISNPMRAMLSKGTFGGRDQQITSNTTLNIQAYDGTSVKQMFETHGDVLGRIMVTKLKKAVKNGEFRGSM
ncbi:MAG TPA: hypothetical protein VN577_10100 [Terriglobales bacterium]|nr:hypothetical protein [Terriglobales bacterium]